MSSTSTSSWLSLTELSRLHGISALHCGKTLREYGWRNLNGTPTQKAFEDGVVMRPQGLNHQTRTTLWNKEICKSLFEVTKRNSTNRSLEIEQWTTLLEALEEGCPSINETAAQMAKDLPTELIGEVNNQLALRGCGFRVTESIGQSEVSKAA